MYKIIFRLASNEMTRKGINSQPKPYRKIYEIYNELSPLTK